MEDPLLSLAPHVSEPHENEDEQMNVPKAEKDVMNMMDGPHSELSLSGESDNESDTTPEHDHLVPYTPIPDDISDEDLLQHYLKELELCHSRLQRIDTSDICTHDKLCICQPIVDNLIVRLRKLQQTPQ